MSFSVVPDELRVAAARLRTASEAVRTVALAGAADRLGDALPGGPVPASATALAESWRRAQDGWSAAADAHGDALVASADTYRATDDRAETSFGMEVA